MGNPTKLAGPDLNTSPSTTSIGNATDLIAFTADNYNYQVNPNDPADFNGDADAILTFALSFDALNTYISNNWASIYNGTDPLPTAPTIDGSSVLRFIAFTATNTNTINQDLFGIDGIQPDVTFSGGGGFSAPTYGDGSSAIPEPSTFASVGVILSFGLLRRPRRRRL